MSDIAPGIGYRLHVLPVVVDGEIPLPHGELMQEDDVDLLVGQKKALGGDLELARCLIDLHGEVLDGWMSGVMDLRSQLWMQALSMIHWRSLRLAGAVPSMWP